MSYTSRADLVRRYGADEIDQREMALSAGTVDQAIADADALIDGYLASRYSLPLSSIPANLPQVASVIARYSILGDSATEQHRNDYKDALAWLKDVAAGRVQLQAAMPVPGSEPATVVMVASSPAVFKRAGRP